MSADESCLGKTVEQNYWINLRKLRFKNWTWL